MRKYLLIVLVASIAPTIAAQSSTQDIRPVEIFAGYSLSRIKAQTQDENNFPIIKQVRFDGFNVQVTGKINKIFGITGDVSGHYRSDTFRGFVGPQRIKARFYNFLVGPEVKARNGSRYTPFAHALFGVAHLGNSISGFGNFSLGRTNFAMAFGGGLDVDVSKRIAIRVVQADYNPTFFGHSRQNNTRFSFGVVFK